MKRACARDTLMAVDPDRWHHVERLYHAALARDEGERAAFLRDACAGDETLRREVESLLTYASHVPEFLAVPALEGPGAALIESDAMTGPLFRQRFGPYEIGSLLGAGGMGDVYRARDSKLDRDVAIKILPAVFTADPDRRARFEREARLLAALNHPRIGAIYGFEDREGIHGLVLELVEGQTLAERLRAGPLPIPEALTIARQIAEALEAAHEKGIVSPLGGEPTLFLANSSGVTWLDERRILFSEVNPPYSNHMGVVTAMEDRSQQRTVYFPQDVRGMVHLSYASPDRKWVLVLEMNPVWQPCRVVPLDGRTAGWQVGPKGKCTSAAWSPDGKWMYFGVEVEGHHHLWRQRFPAEEPEQITSGPTEEDGVAVAPDGRSLITSIGIRESAIWIHTPRGARQLSSEGSVPSVHESGLFGTIPRFSLDGRGLLYLRSESREAAVELWRADLESGKSEKALPGLSISEYDVSTDGKEVVFSTQPAGKPSQIWLAALDRSSPPQLIASAGEDSPHFGPDGQILVRLSDGKTHYLARIDRDGSGRSKVVPYPIGNIQYISPDRRWITVITTTPDGSLGGTFAVPTAGGAPRRICSGCPVIWSPDGKFLYAAVQSDSRESPGKTRVFPLQPGEMLPELPPLGMRTSDDPKLFPGSYLIDAYEISPSPDPSVYAYVKTRMHRNLFRITLP